MEGVFWEVRVAPVRCFEGSPGPSSLFGAPPGRVGTGAKQGPAANEGGDEGLMARGTVKWFSEEKGYGFVSPNEWSKTPPGRLLRGRLQRQGGHEAARPIGGAQGKAGA